MSALNVAASFFSGPFSEVQPQNGEWTNWQKWNFRTIFIFFIFLVVPIDIKFYQHLFTLNWKALHFTDLIFFARYLPDISFSDNTTNWQLHNYLSWGILFGVAIIGSFWWGKADLSTKQYEIMHHWLRVIVRYKLAFILLVYGFYKFFRLQMPFPSLSNLVTNYGDFYPWKVYFQTIGISPKYETFIGFIEIAGAFLLFNRKTTPIAAALVIGFHGNIFAVNIFYDVGEVVLSSYLLLLALFLFIPELPRLHDLLIKEKKAIANHFVPAYQQSRLRSARLILKGIFLFIGLSVFYFSYSSFKNDPFKIPHTPGLANAYGFYNVKQFILNGDTLAYSKINPARWQDVVFEKWSTLSINISRPVKIDKSNGDEYHANDIDRNYELAGFSGRHYFYYEADTVNHKLKLQNKNKNHRNEVLNLSYQRPDEHTILLSGTNERGDSVNVVLEKVQTRFLMFEGRRQPVKL